MTSKILVASLSIILLLFSGFESFSQEFKTITETECARYEALGNFRQAKLCIAQNLPKTEDSAKIASLLTVKARIYDEYFEYDSALICLDSAEKLIPKTHHSLAEFLKEKGYFFFSYNENEQAINYYQKALQYATKTIDSIDLYGLLATNHVYLEDTASSLQPLAFLNKKLQSSDSLTLGLTHRSLGLYYYDIGELVNAVIHLKTAKHLLLAQNLELEKASYIMYILGDVFGIVNNSYRATELHKEVLELRRKINSTEYHNSLNSLGWSYYNSKETDSALHYINLAIQVYNKQAPNSILLAYPYGNLGLIYNSIDSTNLAIKASKKSLELFEEMGYVIGQSEALNNIGKALIKHSKYQLAKSYFLKAKGISDSIWYDPFETMKCLNGLSKVAEHEGQTELAFKYLKRSMALKDSIFDLDKATKLQVEEMNRALEIANIQMAKIEEEKANKAQDLKRSQLALFAFGAVFFVLAGSIIIIAVSWKQRQQALHLQSETLSINQEIIRMISHDFRGPMSNIRSLMEILKEDEISREEFDQLSDTIYQQISDVSLMFETFVGWALSQSDNYVPKPDETDWIENLNEVVSLLTPLASFKGIELVTKYEAAPIIQTDRIASQLIFRNLISNAIKFSHEHSQVHIRVFKTNKYIGTEIRDFGIGMNSEQRDNIFAHQLVSSEGTHNEKGTGLGLKMAFKFAELNGGHIQLDSKEGEGTVFTVYFPL